MAGKRDSVINNNYLISVQISKLDPTIYVYVPSILNHDGPPRLPTGNEFITSLRVFRPSSREFFLSSSLLLFALQITAANHFSRYVCYIQHTFHLRMSTARNGQNFVHHQSGARSVGRSLSSDTIRAGWLVGSSSALLCVYVWVLSAGYASDNFAICSDGNLCERILLCCCYILFRKTSTHNISHHHHH